MEDWIISVTKLLRICGQVGAKIYKTRRDFWTHYQTLPREIQQRANKGFDLLKRNPKHPSLDFKKIGTYWSVRVTRDYRALAREEDGILVWFWIGKPEEYMRQIR